LSLVHKFFQGGEYFVLDVNSGAVHVVDELIYSLIQEDKPLSLEEACSNFGEKYSRADIEEALKEINEIKTQEMLYSKDYFEDIALRDSSKSFIKALCLNIAHDCNLKCKYCFAEEGEYNGRRKLMSLETGKKAVDFVIKQSGSRRNIEIDLFGGEPLMAFDTIKEIVAYAKEQEKLHKKNIRFTMTTNATLLNDEIMEYIDKNMGNIVLSIDGRQTVNDKVRTYSDGSGCYDDILPNIKKMADMRDRSKQYYVRGTFTNANLDFDKDVIHMAELGFDEISIEPVVLSEDNELALKEEDLPQIYEAYDRLYDEMLNRHREGKIFKFYHFNIDLQGGPCIYKRIAGCGAGHEYVAVTPEGDIYPCHQFVGNDVFKLGSIYTGEFNEAMAVEFKNAHIYNKPKCRDCWARFYCSGGCQANNFSFNKDIHIPYELGCELAKKRIECAIALKCNMMDR
jgi:uncharacterized protein